METRSPPSTAHGALVSALYLAVALFETAPLLFHFTTSVPFGNYPASTVVRLNLWTLWWNQDRLLHGYQQYWQAPMFYPDPHSFAYSEPQWLTGVIASALWWISESPALPYNFVLLLAFVLNGWCGYLLVRRLGILPLPALYAGLVVEVMPTVADQLGVLQSIMLFPILITLTCLVAFGRTGRGSAAIGMAVGMAFCFHMNSNAALFFAPLAALGLLVLGGQWLRRPRALVVLGVAALAAGAMIAPVAVFQEQVLRDVVQYRSASEIAGTSAHFGTYASMPPTNLLRRRPPDRHTANLYPGQAMLVLAALGACAGLRQRELRRWTSYALLATALSLLLSFGPLLHAEPFGSLLSGPYEFLRAYYPGFRMARNLWRFGALAQVFIALLAGIGVAACVGRRQSSWRLVLGTIAAAAVFLDVACTAIPLLDLGRPGELAWVRWLRDAPPGTRIVHIPMPQDTTPDGAELTAYWMTCQMYHGRPMANGYSAYIPGPATLLMQVMPTFPDANSIRVLRYFGVTHVLASAEWATEEQMQKVARWDGVVIPEAAPGDMRVFRIVDAAPEETARQRASATGLTVIR